MFDAALISTPLPSPERKPCDSSLKGRSMKAKASAASFKLLKARVKLLVRKFFMDPDPARKSARATQKQLILIRPLWSLLCLIL